METTTLKQQIKQALNVPEEHFSNHASDLYVKHSPEVEQWLKDNYKYFRNCKGFHSQVDRSRWIEIPFGYMDEDFAHRHPGQS